MRYEGCEEEEEVKRGMGDDVFSPSQRDGPSGPVVESKDPVSESSDLGRAAADADPCSPTLSSKGMSHATRPQRSVLRLMGVLATYSSPINNHLVMRVYHRPVVVLMLVSVVVGVIISPELFCINE